MSEEQWVVVKEAYKYGEPYDLGYTLASISLVESSAGINVENNKEGSYGVPQIRLITALSRLGVEDTPLNRLVIKNRLINDNEFAFELAIEEILYWMDVRDNWRSAVSSYNAGWRYHLGQSYMHKVVNYLNQLRQCNISIKKG